MIYIILTRQNEIADLRIKRINLKTEIENFLSNHILDLHTFYIYVHNN